MVIGSVKNLTAHAKMRHIVRNAEKVCRIITDQFPASSPTRAMCFQQAGAPKYGDYFSKLAKDYSVNVRPNYNKFGEDSVEFYKALVETVKKHKMANCEEYSRLTHLIFGLNGVKTQRAILLNGLETCDHSLQVYSSAGRLGLKKMSTLNDAIVIDSWLGFATPAKEASQKFAKEYSSFTGIDNPKMAGIDSFVCQNPPVTEKVIAFFKEQYPQLFIVKKPSLIKH